MSSKNTAKQLIHEALSRARTSISSPTGEEGLRRPAREVAMRARAEQARELGDR